MKTNENICNNVPEEVIVLGVASIETQGGTNIGEGNGLAISPGISEE